MRLCHPPDGSTSPKYKLVCFIKTKKICKEKNALAFNRDRCCHLVLCLRLIPFHSMKKYLKNQAEVLTRPMLWNFSGLNLLFRLLSQSVWSLQIFSPQYTFGLASAQAGYNRVCVSFAQRLECKYLAFTNVLAYNSVVNYKKLIIFIKQGPKYQV